MLTPGQQAVIASFDQQKTDAGIVEATDAESDMELITNSLVAKSLALHQGRINLTLSYAPGSDFTGSFVLEVQVPAESDLGALSALYGELSVLLTRVMVMCSEMRTGGER